MKKYTLNFIIGGNLEIEFSAKNDEDAIQKAYKLKKLNDRNHILKEFSKNLISFEPTVIEDENGKEVFNKCTGEGGWHYE